MREDSGKIIVVMGVSASGKSTLGKALAGIFGIPFFDGDDYHPQENIDKMSAGRPLGDSDRKGWLRRLNTLAKSQLPQGAVLACSALKEQYRQWLGQGIEDRIVFVVLLGSFEALSRRIENRKGHYMPPSLLQSQFDALEVPEYGIHLDCTRPLSELVEEVKTRLTT